jgi:acetate kinase
LFGVSGVSSDMRVLLQSDSADAKLAIDLFVYRVGSWIGMLAAELEGLDGLIFTAGIGENAAPIREMICQRAAWLGAKIDADKNAKNAATIHHPESKLAIHIIPTNEELMIAQHTARLLR